MSAEFKKVWEETKAAYQAAEFGSAESIALMLKMGELMKSVK